MPTAKPCIQERVIGWWRQKIRNVAERCFESRGHRVIARWAEHIYDQLVAGTPLSTLSRREFAAEFGVPTKYLSRAIAILTRCGPVTGTLREPVSLTFRPERLLNHKNPAQARRGRISAAERARLLRADRGLRGPCGRRLDPGDFDIDHIILVSILGADEPANWVASCRNHNRERWDRFDRLMLKRYRGERVVGSIDIRFKGGFFWPVINDHLRTETRKTWAR